MPPEPPNERFFPRPAHEVAAVALLVAIVVVGRLFSQRREAAGALVRANSV